MTYTPRYLDLKFLLVSKLAYELVCGLQDLERLGLAHRDLKLENVVLHTEAWGVRGARARGAFASRKSGSLGAGSVGSLGSAGSGNVTGTGTPSGSRQLQRAGSSGPLIGGVSSLEEITPEVGAATRDLSHEKTTTVSDGAITTVTTTTGGSMEEPVVPLQNSPPREVGGSLKVYSRDHGLRQMCLVKIVDFDTIEMSGSEELRDVLGTDQYIAPETYLGTTNFGRIWEWIFDWGWGAWGRVRGGIMDHGGGAWSEIIGKNIFAAKCEGPIFGGDVVWKQFFSTGRTRTG